MTSVTTSFLPPVCKLELYAGDGASILLTVTNPDGDAIPLDGEVSAQIRHNRNDADALEVFDVTLATNTATLVLSGEQTAALGQFRGDWDCQWTPAGGEPQTLIQGPVSCTLDVTRG